MLKPQMSKEEIDKKYKEIRGMMDSDTRTADELFASLCNHLRQQAADNGNSYSSDDEVEKAVHRLVGLCETIMGIN